MSIGLYEFTVREPTITVRSFLRQRCGLSARSLTVIKYQGGSITRDGKELRAHDILHGKGLIQVQLPRERCDITPVSGNLDILYEDRYLLAINKPANTPVHPTKVHQLDTLANLVSDYQQSRGESYIFRALNRLDKDTSGIVLIAKDRIAYTLVQPSIHKTYIAVAEGLIPESGTVNAPIALEENSKIRRSVSEHGQTAVTHYEPIRYGGGHTMCRVTLETGRTHQIRCHFSYLGHPLAGDDLYGGSTRLIDRQALHCDTMTFVHPVSKEIISLDAAVPAVFDPIISG